MTQLSDPMGEGAPLAGGATPDQPISAGERLVSLDFIRGFAVLGILFANVVAYSAPFSAYSWPGLYPQPMSAADDAVWLFQLLFIDHKMRGLFSLLFGAGMLVFLDRAWARGEGRWLQARRLIWLGLFGLAHFFLLYWGDILFNYALAGLVGLLLVKLTPKRQLQVGLAWYAVGALLIATFMGLPALQENAAANGEEVSERFEQAVEAHEASIEKSKAETAAFTSGNYLTEISYTANEQAGILANYPGFALFETVPLMMIGMALYRMGLFSGGFEPARQRRWGWIGIAVGTALTLPTGLWAISEGYPYFLTEFVFNGSGLIRLPTILGYAALLSLISQKAVRSWLGERLAASGRMAFTNYIATSAVMMVIFRGWGLGLYGELTRVELLAVLAFGWALMLLWSKPWLDRFRYGPLEWLWRCLTYWQVFPLRR